MPFREWRAFTHSMTLTGTVASLSRSIYVRTQRLVLRFCSSQDAYNFVLVFVFVSGACTLYI
jgi:hypothetical protein